MIIIAPDKFKGTLSAAEAAAAIAEGLREGGLKDEMLIRPMADGGDDTAAVLKPLLGKGEAVVESHEYAGPQCFAGIPAWKRSSRRLGNAITEALKIHTHIYIGVGGTATCDGGAGLLQGMGMKAYRADGSEIVDDLTPERLREVARVDLNGLPDSGRITVLTDVEASLVPTDGINLSALDFAVQKGFEAERAGELEGALRHFAKIASGNRSSVADGAGGGIGFALCAVAGARCRKGAEFIADLYELPFSDARLVVSGEGCIDNQTGGGKVVAEIARRTRLSGRPFVAFGGRVRGHQPFPVIATCGPDDPVPHAGMEAAEALKNAARKSVNFVTRLLQ